MLGSTLIWRRRASGEGSPTVLPWGIVPLRWIAPAVCSMASISVVLPLV